MNILKNKMERINVSDKIIEINKTLFQKNKKKYFFLEYFFPVAIFAPSLIILFSLLHYIDINNKDNIIFNLLLITSISMLPTIAITWDINYFFFKAKNKFNHKNKLFQKIYKELIMSNQFFFGFYHFDKIENNIESFIKTLNKKEIAYIEKTEDRLIISKQKSKEIIEYISNEDNEDNIIKNYSYFSIILDNLEKTNSSDIREKIKETKNSLQKIYIKCSEQTNINQVKENNIIIKNI